MTPHDQYIVKSSEQRIPVAGWGARFLFGIGPAAVITLSLFLAMQALTRADDVVLPGVKPRTLVSFLPTLSLDETIRRQDRRVERLAVLSPPPAAQPLSRSLGEIDLPIITMAANGPQPGRLARLKPAAFLPAIVQGRLAEPVRAPVPSYPAAAESRGIEGTCEVSMDISSTGKPFNLQARCSHPYFDREAVRAVSRAEFLPAIEAGRPVEMRNVVYPLEFKLAD